jgi:hypothetical protein
MHRLTGREILFKILTGGTIYLHLLFPSKPLPLPFRALALALLGQHILQVLRAPVDVLGIVRVLERPGCV